MATEKNITMKQFNGTDYDTLYPKTIASQIPNVYSKTDIITAETLTQLGLTADKLPNDAFQQIKTLIDINQYIPNNNYNYFRLKLHSLYFHTKTKNYSPMLNTLFHHN